METRDYENLSPELLEKVSRLELKARMVVEGLLTGMHKSPFQGYNVEFLEHREYRPGDDPRRLDWKLFARRDKFFIKQYEDETNLRAYVLLDSSASMRFGGGEHGGKLGYAALLAACLGYLFIKQGDAVGLVTFDKVALRQIEPRGGRTHFYRMLGALEENGQGRETDVAGALARFGEQIKRRSLVVLISDLLVEPGPVFDSLKTLRRRQSEMVIFNIMDTAEVDFPFPKASRFIDVETGAALPAEPSVIRREYKRNLNRHIDLFRSFCKQHTIEFVHAVTSDPVEKVLLGYLEQRERRKRAAESMM
jgi:uncharacterized protein (DUF58 family)